MMSINFDHRLSSDQYACRISEYFIMEANTMNPDQTAPKGAVCSGFILLAILATKVHKHTAIVVNKGKRLKLLIFLTVTHLILLCFTVYVCDLI